jgi:hypothetical protein
MRICKFYDASSKREYVYNFVTAFDLFEFNKLNEGLGKNEK